MVPIDCRGRDHEGLPALEQPINIGITLIQHKPDGTITVSPTRCMYNTGSHGQRCKASHPDQDKVGDGVTCPYSFDYPYVLEQSPRWVMPEELREPMRLFDEASDQAPRATRPVRVVHRSDKLLQQSVERADDEGLTGSRVIDEVTVPTHRLLLTFLDELLVGQEFKSEEEIQAILDTWPTYTAQRGLTLSMIWTHLVLRDGVIHTKKEGPGGAFECATIEEVAPV